MNKQELEDYLQEIDYTMNSITHTVEYLNGCLIELAKQKENITHQLYNILNKRSPVGFKTNQSKDGEEGQSI